MYFDYRWDTMGIFSDKFSGESQDKEEKESIEILQKMSRDFKIRERELAIKRLRIDDKRSELEKKEFDLSIISVERPDEGEVAEYSDSQSMYEMLKLIDRKLNEENDYLDRLEKAYDEALSED
jgi:hypothetical protein